MASNSAPGSAPTTRHVLGSLRARADLLARIRSFFAARAVLEVETPVLGRYPAPDPHITAPSTLLRIRGHRRRRYYLHSSPEPSMKRLLAAGAGPIYQVCKVFRDDESGALHRPEFTLLEWYQPGYDQHRLMSEVAALLKELGLAQATRLSYRAAFQKTLSVDPLLASTARLRSAARRCGWRGAGDEDRALLLDYLLAFQVGPRLGWEQPLFLHHYPADQAMQARLCPADPRLAERFELFIQGVEIANGAGELTDAAELRRRLRGQGQHWDREWVAALESGLPECAGVAVGLDRLLMVLSDARHLREVLALEHPATTPRLAPSDQANPAPSDQANPAPGDRANKQSAAPPAKVTGRRRAPLQ